MKVVHTSRARMLALAVVLLAVFAAGLGSQAASAARNEKAQVFSPNAHPYGQSYSEWAADWWQWVLDQPLATNPITDETGAQCANNQRGRVWFLAGSASSAPVHRTCTVPHGKALLLPVLNSVWVAFAFDPSGTFPPDPPNERTEAFVRQKAHFVAAGLTATIDGVSVPNVQRYVEQSQLFSVTLPSGNLFDLAGGFVLDPCADEGYYLMVKPLSRGTHTIRITGTNTTEHFTNDVTYTITVPGEGGDDGE